MLAMVLSGTRIDATGALQPIGPSELREAYEALRGKDPKIFTASADQILCSHYQQAMACEAAGNWAAALVHLDALIAAGRGVQALRYRRAQAHAELEHWGEAVEDCHSLSPDERDDQHWYRLALLELGSGNRKGYREACAMIYVVELDRMSNPLAGNNLAWVCSLAPEAGVDASQVVARAEAAVAAQRSKENLNTLGVALIVPAGLRIQSGAWASPWPPVGRHPLGLAVPGHGPPPPAPYRRGEVLVRPRGGSPGSPELRGLERSA